MIYQQSQRWIKKAVFENMTHDPRVLLRLVAGRNAEPGAALLRWTHRAEHS
jgi:hypothetical protein